MKKSVIVFLALVAFIVTPLISNAQEEGVTSKFPIKIYGLLWGNGVWGDSETDLLNNLTLKSINAPTHAVDEATVSPNDGYIGFTAQNTRLGFQVMDHTFNNGIYAGGKVEFDFWNQNTNQFRPRMRLGFVKFGKGIWSFEGGQDWDVFSPLLPATTNAAILWMSGNLGFRRPQMRFTIDYKFGDGAGIKYDMAVANPGNWDIITQPGLDTSFPDIQDSLAYYNENFMAGKLYLGVSTLFGKRNYGRKRNIWGYSLSLQVPLHNYFQLVGEVAYSKGTSDYMTNASTDTNGTNKVFSVWANLISKWTGWFETVVGYGLDDPKRMVPITAGVVNVNKNQMILGALKFHPVKPLTLAVEYENIRTNYVGGGKGTANVVLFSTIYAF
ncbi:MAG: hypothetical protein ABIE74_02580 [Pseudomonadota bacterium]